MVAKIGIGWEREMKEKQHQSPFFFVTCPRDGGPWREIVSVFLKLGDLTICEFPH
jgi:hypothetical protein